MDDKYVTTLRLYKNNPAHFQALTCLEEYNRELFTSQNDYIAEAVIYYSEYLKQKAEYEKLENTLSNIREQEDYFRELTKRALEDVLGSVQVTKIPAVTGSDTKSKEEQENRIESELPVETANRATEKDYNLLNFYSSFTGFEDEGED
ncbi:hypothetical protein QMP26_30550 [Enterocloster clostridioformis]|uniref:hypothetical protein n=1 Tax=Enterocloster clostridioformis TaxID=1531 RepID=UPI0026761841|nr:hypothetical protein [Enterocloster clostridioformis]